MRGIVSFVLVVFTSLQHIWSYQDGYQLATVRIHGGFIVLSQLGLSQIGTHPDMTTDVARR